MRPVAAYHRPMSITDPADLRDTLRGTAGFILDADGVIVLKGEPIPGSVEALARLEARGTPYRVVTNFSLAHRTTLARRFATRGTRIDPDRIITAASAAAAYTADQFAGRRLVVLAAPDALREFDGQDVLTMEAARASGPGEIAAVVIGDGGDDLSFANLDTAFRLIRAGAAFLAMHRNPWWLTPRGPTLDAGAAVVGLEFATGVRATILGKPSPTVFREGLAGLSRDLRRRVSARDVVMIGDDPDADLRPAQRLGMRAILVLSGKVDAAQLEIGALGRGRRIPDAVATSLAHVVAALD